jgi:hypothetical protein
MRGLNKDVAIRRKNQQLATCFQSYSDIFV